jgi:outer membrane protein TolC
LSITQPLYAGGKIRLRNQQAGLGIQVAGADLEKSQQQTVFDVARAYYSILLTKELVRITEDTTGQFRAIERLTQSLIDKGDEFVTTADLARIRTLRLLAENQKVEFQRSYDLTYAALRQVMGLDFQAPLAIVDEELPFKRTTIALAEIVELAMTRRPELAKADIGVRNAVLQEKLAKAEFLPTVGLFGSLNTLTGRRSFPNPGNDELWQLGVAGEMPLFTGGRNLAAVRQARYQLQQAQETQRLARDLITLEVQQAYLEYKEMDERIPLAEAALRDARTTVDAYNKRYAGNQVADKDMPKFFEDLETANLLQAVAKAQYNQQLYAYNLALAKIRLVTASHEY